MFRKMLGGLGGRFWEGKTCKSSYIYVHRKLTKDVLSEICLFIANIMNFRFGCQCSETCCSAV